MKKKLTDIVFGGIYEYRDKDNKIIYRGSTEFEDLIEDRSCLLYTSPSPRD